MAAGEWSLNDIKARIAALQAEMTVVVAMIEAIEVETGDGLAKVGSSLRLDIPSLPLAPEN